MASEIVGHRAEKAERESMLVRVGEISPPGHPLVHEASKQDGRITNTQHSEELDE
jgi:hypothetical protein